MRRLTVTTLDGERGAGEWWRLMYWTSREYENEIANLNEQIMVLQEAMRTMTERHLKELAEARES